MRFSGRLQTWNDERGFGFIRPADGGQDVFVHVSSLPRPVPGPDDVLTFEVALNRDGKKKAIDVRLQRVELQGFAEDRQRAKRHASVGSVGDRRYRRRRWPAAVALIVILAVAGSYAYKRLPRQLVAPAETTARPVSRPDPAAGVDSRFRCDGRTMCRQMTSCEEAKYFLRNCPGTRMDGNNDGIPCEQQWCR